MNMGTKNFRLQSKSSFVVIATLVTILSLTSCSDEIVEIQASSTSTSNHISNNKIKEKVESFLYAFHNNDNQESNKMPQVREVSPYTSNIYRKSIKSSTDIATIQDTLFYVVNLSDGYVITSCKEDSISIYAYIENGTFNDNSQDDEGIKFIVNNILSGNQTLVDTMTHLEIVPDTFYIKGVSPKLSTLWKQSSPYSMYCPGNYTGCVPTALGQIMSFYRYPTSGVWKSNITNQNETFYLDWNNIIKYNKLYKQSWSSNIKSRPYFIQVAKLMQYLGREFNANYLADGTGVSPNAALNWMRTHGYYCSTLKDYDCWEVADFLRKGYLIFMQGSQTKNTFIITWGYGGRHTWVIDGYKLVIDYGNASLYVHCNWGAGGDSNGYYLNSMFNTYNENMEIDDSQSQYAMFDYKYQSNIQQ